MAAYTDRPTADIIETHQQFDDSRFASTGRPNQCNGLPTLNRCREIFDDGFANFVAKMHVVELHTARNLRGLRRHRSLRLLFSFEERKHALGRSGHLLQHIRHLSKLGNGLREIFHVLDKSLNITNGNASANGKQRTSNGNSNITQVAHKIHHGHHQARKELRLPRRFIQFGVRFLELRQHIALFVEGTHYGLSRKCLFNLPVNGTQAVLLHSEVLLASTNHHFHQDG